MMRRTIGQPSARVSTDEDIIDPNDVDAEIARRVSARRMIDKRVDQEMKRISSPERARCRLFGCFPRTRRPQSATVARREPSNLEQRVFGKAVKATPAETKLTEVIGQLQALIAEQESKVERGRAHARAAYKPGQDLKQNKEALQALKRVKQMEKQLEGLQGQLVMVERQRDSLEESQMQKKLVAALSQSAKVMKANGPLVKQAEQVADTAVEFFDQNEDIANALSQVNDDGDDDELLAELEEIAAADEAIEAALDIRPALATKVVPEPVPTAAPVSKSLPTVPTKSLERTSLLAAA